MGKWFIRNLMGPGISFALASAPAMAATCTPTWTGDVGTDTSLLQQAINECTGGGFVDLKSNGKVSTVTITSVSLASNLVMKLEKGFILKEAPGQPATGAMITGKNITNVTITGTGTLDGDGASYWASAVGNNNTARPKLLALEGSNLKIGSNFSDTGVSQSLVAFPTSQNSTANALVIRNSPKEQLVVESGSSNVTIDGVWIYANPARNSAGKNFAPNTDGIDIIGTNTAKIQNCLIDTGDDDIAIKSNAGDAATKNVTITACVIGGGHGISIGGQEAAGDTIAAPGVSQVAVSKIQFSGTDFGYRIKTDETAADSGATTGVSYSETCMRGVGQPFLFTDNYTAGTGGNLPIIANVTADNIVATATKSQGALVGLSNSLIGIPSSVDAGIRITNTSIAGGNPFSVTYGELQLGSNSTLNSALGSAGQLVRVKDTGPTVSCPASISIPTQI
jgi:polygalacturonase